MELLGFEAWIAYAVKRCHSSNQVTYHVDEEIDEIAVKV